MGERTFQTETNAWNQNLEGETAGEFWEQQAIQLDWKNRGSQSTAAWQRRGGSETQAPVAQRGPGAVGSRPLPPPRGAPSHASSQTDGFFPRICQPQLQEPSCLGWLLLAGL